MGLQLFSLYILAGQLLFSQVDTVWIRRYNNPFHSSDYACGIDLDTAGNIYVTGRSAIANPVNNDDIVTIKYNPNGDSIWTVRLDDEWHKNDVPIGIIINPNSDIYIGGYGYGPDGSCDFITLKYYSNGSIQWVYYQNGYWGDDDLSTSFTIDDSENIYLTGNTNGVLTHTDFMTTKSYTNGSLAWRRIYNHTSNKDDMASDIAVDTAGNVYVTGTSYDHYARNDIATIKYDKNGTEEWIARYNGSADSNDIGRSIIASPAGEIYVTGSSWTSDSGYDIIAIHYNISGNLQWIRRYNSQGNDDDYPVSVCLDGVGNIYIAGYSQGVNPDYLLIKYSADGLFLWSARYNGTGSGIDRITAMSLDTVGNCYVTGCSQGAGTNYDYTTIKYDPEGHEVWVIRYTGYSIDIPRDIKVDRNGYVYVTGESFNGAGALYDYVTIKYTQFVGIMENDQSLNSPLIYIENNLFKERLKIKYNILHSNKVFINIYDIQGRKIKTLIDGIITNPGNHILSWNGKNDMNEEVTAGTYFIVIYTRDMKFTQKIIKIK